MRKRNILVDFMEEYKLFIVAILVAVGCISLFTATKRIDRNRINLMLANVETRQVKSCVLTSESSSDLRGLFVLGCGGIHGDSYNDIKYYFYMEGEKGFGLQYLAADKVEIVPMTEGVPYIEGHFDEDGKLYHEMRYSSESEKMTKYFLYLPAEYIVEEYSVNVNEL